MRPVSLPSTKASKMRSIIRRSVRSRSISAFKSFLTVFRCGSYVQISPSRDAHLEHGCLPSHCNVAGSQLFLANEKHQYAGGRCNSTLARFCRHSVHAVVVMGSDKRRFLSEACSAMSGNNTYQTVRTTQFRATLI